MSGNNGQILSSAITGGSTVLGGVAQGLFNSLAAKQQYNYQKKLMQQQQQYTLENYLRQRSDNISDILNSASRQRQALQQAGYSTAAADSSSAATSSSSQSASSAAELSTPSSGNVNVSPVDVASSISAASQAAANILLQRKTDAEVNKLEGETEGINIDNVTRLDENFERLENLRRSGKISDVQFEEMSRQYEYNKKVQQFKAKVEENNKLISDNEVKVSFLRISKQQLDNKMQEIVNRLTDEQRKQAQFVTEHQGEAFKNEQAKVLAEVKELISRSDLNIAQKQVAIEQKLYVMAQTQGVKYQNELLSAKTPFASDMAYYQQQQLEKQIQLMTYQIQSAMARAHMDMYSEDKQAITYWTNLITNGLESLSRTASNTASVFSLGVGHSSSTPSAPSMPYSNPYLYPTY